MGVFGGAFDPPHQAHVALAQAAIEQLHLDELRILPTGQAWHKPRGLSAPEHRLAMARLAFEALPAVRVDARELQRSGPSYTADTLEELARELPGAELHLIMGADQWEVFKTWHRWQDISAMARLCVIARPGSPPPAAQPGLPAPTLLEMPSMDCSATAIRKALARGPLPEPMVPMLPPAVARYISTHGLYGHPPPGLTALHA